MLRGVVLALLLANVGFWLYVQGHLAGLGLSPVSQREPERLQQQVAADKLLLRTAPATEAATVAAPSPPTAEAPAPLTAPATPATPTPPPAAPRPVPPRPVPSTTCWQASGIDPNTALLLRGALTHQNDMAPGWALNETPVPARWIVYLGPLPNAEALQRRRTELRAAGIDHRLVTTPTLSPGLALGTYSTPEAARRALAELTLNGLTNARVVQERAASLQYALRLPALTDAQRRRVLALGLLADTPLQRCP